MQQRARSILKLSASMHPRFALGQTSGSSTLPKRGAATGSAPTLWPGAISRAGLLPGDPVRPITEQEAMVR